MDDNELMARLKRGDTDALTLLIRRHRPWALARAEGMLLDAALAEDAVQETFVKAWRAALSFRGECSEKTWLMRIAVHVCWDMRRSWWFRHMDRSVRLEHLPEPAVPFEERDDTLVRAVCALPAQQREAVLLYYYQDMTLTEIAQVLEVAPSTVKRRLDSAHKTLQRKLEGG